ncbi:MAG: PQQ-binding-like beta-propeller repeat protein [Salinibacter sp.]
MREIFADFRKILGSPFFIPRTKNAFHPAMRRIVTFVVLLVCLGFISGCDIFGGGGGESESRPPSGEDFTYSKKAEPVDVGKVSVAEKTDSKIVFQTSGADLDVEKGEVILSKVPESQLETAPRFLRKVESVDKQDGQVTVSTSKAALTDAVEKASLDLSTSLSGKSKKGGREAWKVTSVAKGVTVKSCDAVQLGNVTLHPEDSNIQVSLTNGTVSFCPDIDASIEISGFSIEEFSTIASGNLTYNTDLSASASATVDLSNSVELATFETYGIAGPVVYTMELSLVAGFEATAGGTMEMSTGIESSGSLKLGARYKNKKWSPVSNRSLSFDSRPVEWGREAGATVRGYVRPEITVFLYETAGPTLFIGPYVELAAEKSEDLVKDYRYGAFGGLNGGVGYDIEILELGIAEYEKSIFDFRTEIAGAGPTNPTPNEASSPQPSDGSETSGTNPTLTWDASDPDSDDLTYDVYFGTSSSPQQVASGVSSKSYDPGSLENETTYYWKIVVTDQDDASAEGPVWSFTTPSDGEISGGLADAPWPRDGRDLKSTGRSPNAGPEEEGIEWSFQSDASTNRLQNVTIGANGTIYVGSTDESGDDSDDNNLYAVNPDGSQKWVYDANPPGADESGGIQAGVAIGDGGTLYAGSGSDHIHAIEENGSRKWINRLVTQAGINSSPAIIGDGTIYIGTNEGKLHAINPDGSIKWTFDTGGRTHSPAVASDGTIYVGVGDLDFSPGDPGKVYAINPDGTQKWVYQTGGEVKGDPAIGPDGTVYVGARDDKVYAFNPDGTLKWSFSTNGYVNSDPAIGPNGTVYVGSKDDHLYALNPDGSLKWEFQTGGDVNSAPAVGGEGRIYFGSNDGFLYALKSDGTQAWRVDLGDRVGTPAIGADGRVYVGADTKLYAIGP